MVLGLVFTTALLLLLAASRNSIVESLSSSSSSGRSLSYVPRLCNTQTRLCAATAAFSSEDSRELLRDQLMEVIETYKTTTAALDEQQKKKKKKKKKNEVVPFSEGEQRIILLIDQLAKLNPTVTPNMGWKDHSIAETLMGRNVLNSMDGVWKLRFTTSVDEKATRGRRGPQTITQMINTTVGTLTNVIEFKEHPGKVKGFRVVYEGCAVSDSGLDLHYKRFVIDRRSSWKLHTVVVPLAGVIVPRFIRKRVQRPTGENRLLLLRQDAPSPSVPPPPPDRARAAPLQLETVYLDDEMRIHVTGDGNYYIHTRLYDVWDPMVGWTMVSAI